MKTKCFLILCMFLGLSICAQEGFIAGKLLDAETQEPIVFATIKIKGIAVGVISNMDGGFQIPYRFKNYSRVLEISSMGYRTKEIPISTLWLEKVNLIPLEPELIQLEEAVVKAGKKKKLTVRQMVKKAIANIPKTFSADPYSTIGYYRDYQMEESQYINLNEAILEVYDQGIGANDYQTTKVLMYDYKENVDFHRDVIALQPYNFESGQKVIDNAFLPNYGGNEFVILRIHDAIRNFNIDTYWLVHRLDTDLLVNHRFAKAPDTSFGEDGLYSIEFWRKKGGNSAFGTLYLSKNDLTIHRMDYTVYDNSKKHPKGTVNKHGGKIQAVFEVKSEYQRLGDKMYLNYISFKNKFKILEPAKFLLENITVNIPKKCLVVNFNNMVNEADALKTSNYNVAYKGKKLKFEKIVNIENQVLLFPKLGPEEGDIMFREIEMAGRKNSLDAKMLYFEIKNLRDIDGNRIYERAYKEIDQFREYFVQQVKPKAIAPKELLFMNKNRPIFKDQPISRPVNFNDYWMNTPLQNIEE